MASNRKYTIEITDRFIEEARRIIALNQVTKIEFSKSVGIPSSNLSRMETFKGFHVTLEQCVLLHRKYGTNLEWLILGDPSINTIQTNITALLKIADNLDKINRTSQRKK